MAESGKQVAASELRSRSTGEVSSLLKAKIEERHKAVFKHAVGQLRETHLLRATRRGISRIKTVLSERKGQV